MTEYRDHYYDSSDGLKLYARIYDTADGLKLYARIYDTADSDNTILCMHGLTRNSSDFDIIAEHLQDRYRVITVDQRGRGNSEWDNNSDNYNPQTYVGDMWALLNGLEVDKVALIGTSMGGLMSMMMGAMHRDRILGITLNDIGPVIETTGLERIKKYVGKNDVYSDWQEIADASKKLHGAAFPAYSNDDWLRMASRTGRLGDDGIIRMNYDPAISKPIKDNADTAIPPDLWPLFDMLKDIPLLTIRGEISDILGAAVLAEMADRHGTMETHIVANEGHATMMEDPACLAAIDMWAKRTFERG